MTPSLFPPPAPAPRHRFHASCGQNVALAGEGRKATRVGGFNHGVVFSRGHLRAGELFEVGEATGWAGPLSGWGHGATSNQMGNLQQGRAVIGGRAEGRGCGRTRPLGGLGGDSQWGGSGWGRGLMRGRPLGGAEWGKNQWGRVQPLGMKGEGAVGGVAKWGVTNGKGRSRKMNGEGARGRGCVWPRPRGGAKIRHAPSLVYIGVGGRGVLEPRPLRFPFIIWGRECFNGGMGGAWRSPAPSLTPPKLRPLPQALLSFNPLLPRCASKPWMSAGPAPCGWG